MGSADDHEFPIAVGNGRQAMTLGPDGNVWFVDTGANRIVRVTPGGTMTPYSSDLECGHESITGRWTAMYTVR